MISYEDGLSIGGMYTHVSDIECRCKWVLKEMFMNVELTEGTVVLHPSFDKEALRTLSLDFFLAFYVKVGGVGA